MVLVYLSNLSQDYSCGTNVSIPESIKAQEKIDQCIWIELNNTEMPQWRECKSFHKLKEFGTKFSINVLPKPFNNPDIVIFEELYWFKYIAIAKELQMLNIPYIIVPRGSMTSAAQHNHAYIKKAIANLMFFKYFSQHALAIQYLSIGEKNASGERWNKQALVIPNGISLPANLDIKQFSKESIRAIFIGRLDYYQKGLDLLLKSLLLLKPELIQSKFTLSLYGPNDKNSSDIRKDIVRNGLSEIVFCYDEVHGIEKEKVLKSSDLFILTSRFEGMPISILEAISHGIPVAVTPGTNFAETVQTHNAGWASENSTIEQLCRMLLKIIREKDTIGEKSSNAIELAQSYCWPNIAKKYNEALLSIWANRHSG